MGFDVSTEKFLGMRALKGDAYTLLLEAPLSSVFQARLMALRYTIVFLVLILVAVFLVVHRLLRRIVVEPISRTNETLARIGTGELNQRVNERAVTEFDALSNGINATVSALGDTIDEVASATSKTSPRPRSSKSPRCRASSRPSPTSTASTSSPR